MKAVEYLRGNKNSQPIVDETENQELNFPGTTPKSLPCNLKVIIVFLAVLLVATTGIAGFYILGNRSVPKEEPWKQAYIQKVSPPLTDNQDVQKSKEVPLVLYAYMQFRSPVLYALEPVSPSVTKVYKSSVDGQSRSEVNIGYGEEGFRFLASEDGKYLAY